MSVTGTQAQGPAGQPTQYLLPRPPYQPQTSPASSTRIVGPCFCCGAVGHLKANCPCLSKSYPFDINSVADGHVLSYTGLQIDKASRQVEAGLIFNVVNKHQLESVEREACQGITSKDMGSEAGPSLKVKTVNRFKTDSVERQSSQGIDESLSKQGANDQNESPNTVNPDIQGIEKLLNLGRLSMRVVKNLNCQGFGRQDKAK